MYQIWIPNAHAPDAIDQVGLSDLTRDGESGPSTTEFLEKGPDGGAGLLVEYFDNTGSWANSKWEPCWGDKKRGLARGRFWWGFPPGKLSPKSLAYKKQVRSNPVPMADGQEWNLPNMLMLPHRLTGDPETGARVREVHPDWNHIYERMAWAYQLCKVAIATDGVIYQDECCDYLVEVLQLNYRVNAELVDRLKLFDDDNWSTLVNLTVDYARLEAIAIEVSQKKTVEIQPGSPPGVGPKA